MDAKNPADRALVKFSVDGKDFEVRVWNSVGTEKFQTIAMNYYRQAHGIIALFDTNDEESYKTITRQITPILLRSDVNMVLVGKN